MPLQFRFIKGGGVNSFFLQAIFYRLGFFRVIERGHDSHIRHFFIHKSIKVKLGRSEARVIANDLGTVG
jgi:hypothetical protein